MGAKEAMKPLQEYVNVPLAGLVESSKNPQDESLILLLPQLRRSPVLER